MQDAAPPGSTPPGSTSPDGPRAGAPGAPSLHHVQRSLRSGNQAALRQELACAPIAAACQLLRGFSLCASSIHADMHHELVETVLRLKWRDDAQLASAVCEFVQDLITANTAFVKLVIGALVTTFVLSERQAQNSSADGEADGGATCTTQDQVLQHVHQALHGILKVCPLAIR